MLDKIRTVLPLSFALSVLLSRASGAGIGTRQDEPSYCLEGTGPGDYQSLCEFTCSFNTCPEPCACSNLVPVSEATKVGKPLPPFEGAGGWPAAGRNSSFADMCMFSCTHGFCPPEYCTNIDPTTGKGPPTCTAARKWMCHNDKCRIADDVAIGAKKRWAEVEAGLVLTDAWADWERKTNLTDDQDQVLKSSFPSYVAWLYGGRKENGGYKATVPFHCGILGEGGESCSGPWECGKTDYVALDLTFRSWMNLHDAFNRMFTSLNILNSDLPRIVKKLAGDFGASDDDASGLKVLKDALGWFDTILGIAGMKSWSDSLTNLVELLSGFKDNAESFLDIIEKAAESAGKEKGSLLGSIDKLDKMTGIFVDAAREATDRSLKGLFAGDRAGTQNLGDLTRDGRFLVPMGTASTWDVSKALADTLKLMSIPKAWASDPARFPVILVHEGESDKSPIELNGWPEGQNIDRMIIKPETASEMRLVHRGYTIWLVVFYDRKYADDWSLQPPKGLAKLDGKNPDYSSLHWNDIARSALDGWLEYNKQNGYGTSKTDFDVLQYDKDFKTPGFFNIPICSIQEAFDADTTNKCPNFPCCPKT